MAKKVLKPEISFRDNAELNKLLERAKRERENKRMTRIGLNTGNVQNADITRSKVPLNQQREDFVKVPEWSKRDVMEQLPSIERIEREHAANVKQARFLLGIACSPELKRGLEILDERKIKHAAKIALVQKLESDPRLRDTRIGLELRRMFWPGSF